LSVLPQVFKEIPVEQRLPCLARRALCVSAHAGCSRRNAHVPEVVRRLVQNPADASSPTSAASIWGCAFAVQQQQQRTPLEAYDQLADHRRLVAEKMG
jgi:hypothetical protein